METKTILSLKKAELKKIISKLPVYIQPKWLKQGTRNELAGFLMTATKLPTLNKIINEVN